ncbi:MAG: TetR/AcrR family transcriptional regulator [Acidimicrobiia bacterium]
MKTERTYTMRARADGVAQTREQILDAAAELSEEKLTIAIGLADVAERAGVTVRTILRHFGSRGGLFEALLVFLREQVLEERETPVGDTARAAQTIVAHYERRGDRVMRMLEEESVDTRIAAHVAQGRRLHRAWVREVFGPQLAAATDAKLLEDLLAVATDVYTWKLLRRDAGLSRARTEERMHTMICRLVGEES